MAFIEPVSNENIYDIAIRSLGTINALSEFIGQIDDLDQDVKDQVTQLEFDSEFQAPLFVPPRDPDVKPEPLVFTGRTRQSVFDIALQMTGGLGGLSKVIDQFTSLTEDIGGKTFEVEKLNNISLVTILDRNLVFSTFAQDVFDATASDWILASGVWNDGGIWIDSETWNDS